jgi:hypothetical protein
LKLPARFKDENMVNPTRTMDKINYSITKFPVVHLHGKNIKPFIHLIKVTETGNAKLSYAGNSGAHMERLRAAKVFGLSPELNYAGDVIRNAGIKPQDWFFFGNNTESLFEREKMKHSSSEAIISTNAGNAPLHDWEVNYAADQSLPLAAKDYETADKPLSRRAYFCATYGPKRGIGIEYVRFTEEGRPVEKEIELAVGGRPLVHENKAVGLDEVLKTSLTDPRHVLLLPEVDLGDRLFMPIGLRTLQEQIRNGEAASIIDKIRAGEFILINLERERECCGEIDNARIAKAFSDFGYQKRGYEIEHNRLYVKLRFNPYRHTFWAKRADELFIGIINNNLAVNDGRYDPALYNRALKPIGLTIDQLQNYLIYELQAEEAALMGNGKDPRIYLSEKPHRPEQTQRRLDNDIDIARSAITAGLLSLVI